MIVDIRADQGRSEYRGDGEPVPAMLDRDAPTPICPDPDWDRDAAMPEAVERTWLAPTLAVTLCLLWTGGVAAAAATVARPVLPVDWSALIATLAAGPMLVGIAWLLLRRSGTAEARRFGRTAEAMRAEADALAFRVAALTDALDDNRHRLTLQAEAMGVIGTQAGERLAAIGRSFAGEIAAADAHAGQLDTAARSAREELAALLAALPAARADTAALAQALEDSGAIARRGAEALAVQLVALAEHGRDAETVARGSATALATRVAEIEAGGDRAALRLESAAGATAASIDTLLGRTADAVDTARRDLDAQGEAMTAMVSAHRQGLEAAARDGAEALALRLDTIEAVVARLADRLNASRAAGDTLMDELEGGITRVGGRLDALHDQGVERSQMLAASISALGGSADAMTEALRAGEAMATRTIGTTEQLLLALDAAAREIDETLPDALGRLDRRILQSKGIVGQAKPELLALVTAAESTHDAIEAIAGVIAEQRRTLDHLSSGLSDTLTGGRAKADALGRMVDETIERSQRFAEDAAPRLVEALLRVRETATAAADHARATLADVIPEAADALGTASGEAMRAAAGDTVRRQIDAIAEATDAAVDAATRATERLADQVRLVTEQTALAESRIEDARVEREAADRDTLSRRVSLLIESLNSASIDITRAFSPDIADSAWAAYLKGDRGVFTRRAVRLLDAGDAREVVRLYDGDAGFRDQVNRYIHDFEAMLRTILAQRDGSPLGVTLLSSDMGKLYVALAQAIERLR